MLTLSATRAFRELASIPSKIARNVADRIAKNIQKRFDLGQDPYGKPWQPLAPATLRKGRHPPPLTDTGRGRASIKVRPTRGAGIGISVGTDYMWRHQKGSPRLPRRAFLPTNTLPKEWSEIYRDELEKRIAKKIGGKIK